MKQVLQQLRDGVTLLSEVPAPAVRRNHLLIRTRASLISVGTERMLVEFGKASLISKARSHPDKVRQVLDKIKTDGLLPTLEAVFSRLDEPLPLGYCNSGEVIEVGAGVQHLQVGDRVVSNGAHAEMVCVPKTLVAKIPDRVSDEQAAFTVLGSVGLQGSRLANPTFGETFAVIGLGLVGLITAQLLKAMGCRVIGSDVRAERLALANQFGVETTNVANGGDPVTAALSATNGTGVDGVLITASAKSDAIMHQAAQMCRRRGRIVLVGVVPLNLLRSDFYEKELSFQVSCSYGPGRYDESYERDGTDYPFGYVRWTEGRNFQAVLSALAAGTLQVDPLISHRFELAAATQAYSTLNTPGSLGILLNYPQTKEPLSTHLTSFPSQLGRAESSVVAGVIGAGNFAKRALLPALSKTGATIRCIADPHPPATSYLAKKYNILRATSAHCDVLSEDSINTVFIAVGHHLHAKLVVESLAAGKHVFIEKPLALSIGELGEIVAAVQAQPHLHLMVGFKRRFSPHTVKVKELLRGRTEPLAVSMTINAGAIPPEHWVHDPIRGGGRIIGEGCHFIDLFTHLTGSPISTLSATMMGKGVANRDDKMVIAMRCADGSIGSLNYFANGSKSYMKEQLEIFSDNRVLKIDNFRRLTGYGFKNFRKYRTNRQDKGHAAELNEFVECIQKGGAPLIPVADLVHSTIATIAAMTSAREVRTVVVADEYGNLNEAATPEKQRRHSAANVTTLDTGQ